MNTPKPWDDSVKWLLRQSPQALVSFLVPDAQFDGEVDRELQAPSVIADTLYRVKWRKEQFILHVEFQRNPDLAMGRRLWHYNALTAIHTNLPVCSVVIYLVESNGTFVQSPYVLPLPNGRPTQRLDFDTIKLWEIPPDVFEQPELMGLLPLLPLTQDAKELETVDRMIADLQKAGLESLLMIGFAFSVLKFPSKEQTARLKARFFMLHDILKETWVFQDVRQEGKEEGREEGAQQTKKRDLLLFVEARFPTLLAQAKQAVEQRQTVEQLELLLNKLYRMNTIEEAQAVLLASE